MAITIQVGGRLTRAGIPSLCADLAARLSGRTAGVVTCDVTAATRPDVVVAEALARLRLTARRHGWRLEISGAGPDLLAVLALLGLTTVLPQTGGEAEEREQPGRVEEVVDPRDPAV